MQENALTSAIRKTCLEIIEEQLPDILAKKLDEKIESNLEVSVPNIVRAEIHKMLGENQPARQAGSGKPRARCPECKAVVRHTKSWDPESPYKCKIHGEVTPA